MSQPSSVAPRVLLAVGLGALVLGYWRRGALPEVGRLAAGLASEPLQGPTDRRPFTINYEGVAYEVAPVAAYDLTGIVVTHNDITAIGDDDHDETSLDTKDLCVVWGQNVASGHFRHADFWSNDWSCHWQYSGEQRIDSASISNNHLITDSDAIRSQIGSVRVGDQVRFQGLLVNYKHPSWTRMRRTSITRTDVGGTACEVVFVESIELLRKSPRLWYALVPIGWTLLALALALAAWAMVRRPAFARAESIDGDPERRPSDPRLGRLRRG